MNISRLFILRPVATSLIAWALALAGGLGFFLLPVSPLPQIEFPVIVVSANLPGASAETMAATVAAPLERSLGSIAGVNEITSTSSLGNTRVILQFDLGKNINNAAREVQAGINAASSLLPSGLPNSPSYRKINPTDSPVMIIALTSETLNRAQMYDLASTTLAQRLSQVDGVGQVTVGGGALPAIRVGLDLPILSAKGISLEEVRTAIANANVNRAKGWLDNDQHQWQIAANDQARTPEDYMPIIINWQNQSAIRLSQVATVKNSVQDVRNIGITDGTPSVQMLVYRQPGANIIQTVERVQQMLDFLRPTMPSALKAEVVLERTTTIRASLREVERTLLISVILVVLVVFVFLGNWRATLIPALAIPISLLGTCAVMYLLGYSLNNLSLMALTISTGFVVDDAIVVLENTMRHRERGEEPISASLKGAGEVGFTVLAISISLVAVFIPVLAMGGIIGRLFREFAVTLSVAIGVSMLVSLTLTPMLCARWLGTSYASGEHTGQRAWYQRYWQKLCALPHVGLVCLQGGYGRSLAYALRYSKIVLGIFMATIGISIFLYIQIPKGFFPQQDTGLLMGGLQADQSSSFQSTSNKLSRFVEIIRADPAVAHVNASSGGGSRNTGSVFITLKPLAERGISADEVINRLRPQLNRVPGASLFLQVAQDFRMGGRQSNAQYQYTLQSDDLSLLRHWEPGIRAALSNVNALADVNTDTQEKGLQTSLVIDRDSLARLGFNERLVGAILNDAFGQRIVSTIYEPLNQYRVVMEADPRFLQNPDALKNIYLINRFDQAIPLLAVARVQPTSAPLTINHQGQRTASTISFNLAPGVSLGEASKAIDESMASIGVPSGITGSFQGGARFFQATQTSFPLLILLALITIYAILGILYEHLLHPLTILSTLPAAGMGALLTLSLLEKDFNIITLIGVILLTGIVQKNAIMVLDVAIRLQREGMMPAREAIVEACLLRFRPILMTTSAAFLGALPLALSTGDGAEMRQPLGIAIAGGLLLSQLLTLYTTPVLYCMLDRWGMAIRSRWGSSKHKPLIAEKGESGMSIGGGRDKHGGEK